MSLNTGNAILSNGITLDSSYNVGIGTSTPLGKLHVSSPTAVSAYIVSSGGDYDTNLYLGYASAYTDTYIKRVVGNLSLGTSSTDRIYITSTGNVGIGTSSPSATLEIAKANSGGVGPYLFLRNNTSVATNNAVQISFAGNSGGDATAPTAAIRVTEASDASATMSFYTYGFPAYAERMRITSGGNVGIGTSTTTGMLTLPLNTGNSQISTGSIEIQSYAVNNAWIGDNVYFTAGNFKARNNGYIQQIYFDTDGSMAFTTNSTIYTAGQTISNAARMKITNGGSVQLAKGQLEFTGDNGAVELGTTVGLIKYSSANVILYYGTGDYIIKNNSGASGDIMFVKQDGTIRFAKYTSNGTLTTTSSNGTIAVSSDKNMKIDAGFVENGLDKVLSLKPRYFYWKDEEKFGNKKQLGFYAQEVNDVSEEASNTPEEGQGWGIYDRALIAILVKSVQELNAKVTQQQQQINQLINK